jgi:hypothetical protein
LEGPAIFSRQLVTRLLGDEMHRRADIEAALRRR